METRNLTTSDVSKLFDVKFSEYTSYPSLEIKIGGEKRIIEKETNLTNAALLIGFSRWLQTNPKYFGIAFESYIEAQVIKMLDDFCRNALKYSFSMLLARISRDYTIPVTDNISVDLEDNVFINMLIYVLPRNEETNIIESKIHRQILIDYVASLK